MSTITQAGRELSYTILDKLPDGAVAWEHWDDLHRTLSLLHRNAKTHTRLMEEECNGPGDRSQDWPSGWYDRWQHDLEGRIEQNEKRIRALVMGLPPINGEYWGVLLTGDPRGFTVRLLAPTEELRKTFYNTWGGAEDGYGIA